MKPIQEYIQNAKISQQHRKIFIAQFIDDFLKEKNTNCFKDQITENDPVSKLFEAAAHQLCIDLNLEAPNWLLSPTFLKDPFFVSDLKNSKFLALRDSPYAFRIRNIFVPHSLSHAPSVILQMVIEANFWQVFLLSLFYPGRNVA